MKKTLRREHMGYVYILPWIIGFLVFQLYPLAASLYYSFTSYNITSAPVWVASPWRFSGAFCLWTAD